jgi:putative ABC transport system permease protein
MVVGEGIVTGVMGWALAALAAGPVTSVFGNHIVTAMFRTGLDFRMEAKGVVIWLVVSVVLAAGASLLPAWRAGRVTVREALTYE